MVGCIEKVGICARVLVLVEMRLLLVDRTWAVGIMTCWF